MRVGVLPQPLCQQLGGGARAREHGFASLRAEVTDGLSLVPVPRGRRHHLLASCEEILDSGRNITFFFHRRIYLHVNMRVHACTGSRLRPFLRTECIKVCFLYFNLFSTKVSPLSSKLSENFLPVLNFKKLDMLPRV